MRPLNWYIILELNLAVLDVFHNRMRERHRRRKWVLEIKITSWKWRHNLLICVKSRLNFYRPPTKLPEGNVFTSVCLSPGGIGWASLVPGPFFWEASIPGPRSLPGGEYAGGRWVPRGEYSGDEYPTGVGTQPLLLTPSGSHQNMYGWRAGGTHPTGMLSCLVRNFGSCSCTTFF